jgi:RNA polymerase sigma-70 factor (ECF subfamily)
MVPRHQARIAHGAESSAAARPKGKDARPVDDEMTPPHAPAASAAWRSETAADAVPPPVLPDVARGDRAAVQRCMARYGALVWSIARRFSPTSADAEDATQEIFLDLWRSAARFDAARGSERVFVTMIARRRLIDRMRSQRSRIAHEVPGLEDEAAQVGTDPRIDRCAEAEIARAALEELPQEQRKVIQLSVVEGLSHAEIATRTGLPLGTVKTLIRRGLIKVRVALGERQA